MADEEKVDASTTATDGGGQEQAKPQVSKPNGAGAWVGKLPLRKEVPNGSGEKVREITFREPTAGDIERIGNPVLVELFESRPKLHFEARIMTVMLAQLAGVPPSTIRMMDPKDWNNAAWMIANFFMPDL